MAQSQLLETTLTTLQVLRSERDKIVSTLTVIPYERKQTQKIIVTYLNGRIFEEENKLPRLYSETEKQTVTTTDSTKPEFNDLSKYYQVLNSEIDTGKWFSIDEHGITQTEVHNVAVLKQKKKPRNYDGWLMVE